MKKYLIAFILLLFASTAFANPFMQIMSGGVVATGGSTNDIYDARIRIVAGAGDNVKVVLISQTGTILAVSNSTAISGAGTTTCVFGTSYTLQSGTSYRLGFVADGGVTVGHVGATWRFMYSANSFESPTAVAPDTDGDAGLGHPAIEVRNSSGTVLLGDISGTSEATASGNHVCYYKDAEEY
jgi:hypothetical protein